MARAQGARSQLAVAFETTYGTAPGSGFSRLPFASVTLGSAQPLLQNELLGYGRDPLAPVKDAISVDGDIAVPICARTFGFWLKGAFGQPDSDAILDEADEPTGLCTHVFESGSWTLPSLSIEKQLPDVPRFEMFSGCVVNQISWTMQRSGLLTSTVGLIAQGETAAGTTAAGTLADIGLQRFGHFQGSIARNGTALGNVVSTEITYSNNLDRIEVIRADGKIDGADPSMAMLSGSTVMRFADTTLLTQALNGESCELTFAYTLPGGESLTFVAHDVFLPRPRVEVSGPQGVQVTFEWMGARDPGVGRMCTVTLVNDRASY
jgi:hypothetical protein